jgi:ribosome-associated protein
MQGLVPVTASSRSIELSLAAAQAAADKQARDIVVLDVSERLVITDCFVIVSAPNERMVKAVVDSVEERLHTLGAKAVRREGLGDLRWVLLDYIDCVIHVQHGDERTYYALERLWKDCPRVPFVDVAVAREGAEAAGR